MAQPIHNPFYVLLVLACALLLVTMLIYLVGWFYLPNPDKPVAEDSRPAWMRWVDRKAILLIPAEVLAIFVLSGLTMGLDRFFEDPRRANLERPPESSTRNL